MMDLGSRMLLESALVLLVLMELNYVSTRPSEDTCEMPILARGTIKTRQRNKMLRFSCSLGFRLLGHKYAKCVNGSWDVPMPVCIKRGCQLFPALSNGMQQYIEDYALVMFFCTPGYKIEGASNAYCDGKRWNGTQPSCMADTDTTTSLSCDFESEKLCGWVHDPNHDFDWRRQNLKTPSGHMKTGPSFDHTLGDGKEGYYMYIESTSRLENDTARLMSPVYPASLSKDACFSFFYHMYGRTTGYLIVYQIPQYIDFSSIKDHPDAQAKYTKFRREGNQGDQWFAGYFAIEELQENFQIVIEGIRGPGYISDIAIDDVALLQGEKCIEQMKTTPSYPTFDSCLNRCNSTKKISFSMSSVCECTDSCLEFATCCVDYKDLCLFENLSETSSDGISVDYTVNPPLLPTSQMMTGNKHTNYNPMDLGTTEYSEHSTASKSVTPIAKAPPVTITSTAIEKQSTSMSVPKIINPKLNANVSLINTTAKAKVTIPTLKFVTASQPLINATGILSKVTKFSGLIHTLKPKISTRTTPTTESDMDVLKFNTTTTDESITYFDPEVKVSKTYIHYGRNEYGEVKTETLKAIEKAVKIQEVVLVKKKSISVFGWICIFVVFVLTITLITFREQLKTRCHSIRLPILARTLNIRSFRHSQASDSGDMRFLIQDEEL